MAGLCEGANEPPGSLKASFSFRSVLTRGVAQKPCPASRYLRSYQRWVVSNRVLIRKPTGTDKENVFLLADCLVVPAHWLFGPNVPLLCHALGGVAVDARLQRIQYDYKTLKMETAAKERLQRL
ncbi:hypothetical protein ANN_03416, partial [Periplaneta americana]